MLLQPLKAIAAFFVIKSKVVQKMWVYYSFLQKHFYESILNRNSTKSRSLTWLKRPPCKGFNPANIDLLKFNNKNTRKKFEIYSKYKETRTTSLTSVWCLYC